METVEASDPISKLNGGHHFQIINPDPEMFIKDQHVTYFVSKGESNSRILNEVVREWYHHPECVGGVVIQLNTREILRAGEIDPRWHSLDLLHTAQKAIEGMRRMENRG